MSSALSCGGGGGGLRITVSSSRSAAIVVAREPTSTTLPVGSRYTRRTADTAAASDGASGHTPSMRAPRSSSLSEPARRSSLSTADSHCGKLRELGSAIYEVEGRGVQKGSEPPTSFPRMMVVLLATNTHERLERAKDKFKRPVKCVSFLAGFLYSVVVSLGPCHIKRTLSHQPRRSVCARPVALTVVEVKPLLALEHAWAQAHPRTRGQHPTPPCRCKRARTIR